MTLFLLSMAVGYFISNVILLVKGSTIFEPWPKWRSKAKKVEPVEVYGSARISGEAKIYDSARISGEAKIYDSAWVYGKVRVFDSDEDPGSRIRRGVIS